MRWRRVARLGGDRAPLYTAAAAVLGDDDDDVAGYRSEIRSQSGAADRQGVLAEWPQGGAALTELRRRALVRSSPPAVVTADGPLSARLAVFTRFKRRRIRSWFVNDAFIRLIRSRQRVQERAQGRASVSCSKAGSYG